MAHCDSKQTAASSVPSRTLVTRAGEDMRQSPAPVPSGHSLETEPQSSPVSTQILCNLRITEAFRCSPLIRTPKSRKRERRCSAGGWEDTDAAWLIWDLHCQLGCHLHFYSSISVCPSLSSPSFIHLAHCTSSQYCQKSH